MNRNRIRQVALVLLMLLLPSYAALAQRDPTPTPRGGGRTGTSSSSETVMDMDDWVLLEGTGVSLMVPPEFEGGSVDEMLGMLDQAETIMGDEFAAFFELARQNPDVYKLFAYAPTLLDGGVLTNINITGTPLPLSLPMESILELLPASFPESVEIVDSEIISLGEYEDVGKITLEMEVMRIGQTLAMYAFLVDEQLFAITFTTSDDAFKDLEPLFEQIASTFALIDE